MAHFLRTPMLQSSSHIRGSLLVGGRGDYAGERSLASSGLQTWLIDGWDATTRRRVSRGTLATTASVAAWISSENSGDKHTYSLADYGLTAE